jgi:hypothetical protein
MPPKHFRHFRLSLLLLSARLICRDQRLYVQELQGASASVPKPVTPEGQLRYADGVLDSQRNRLITVCEDHSKPGEAVTTIATVGGCQAARAAPKGSLLARGLGCCAWSVVGWLASPVPKVHGC